eukprot:NODE_12979_length_219_cov_35.782353_g11209_i0.p1 GENE.NODE_12979_length_219_cov_35.782353_g11209_i0~~NODE_12979_length_219_cov_35.782353_g11209_i0.p1  ORF type:complete len:70 (+),score=4.25 NODE_12979_length_219_cov_35.782353_g11209_i0:32-211(+)
MGAAAPVVSFSLPPYLVPAVMFAFACLGPTIPVLCFLHRLNFVCLPSCRTSACSLIRAL